MVGLLVHAATDGDVSGPLNACAPNPVTNAEFTRVLAKIVGRPARLPVPKFGPHLVFGDLADELIYASIRAVPERTLASGYSFRHPELEQALRAVLARGEAA
jgi:NAD dependent epimerase/dehydratase family enzyme